MRNKANKPKDFTSSLKCIPSINRLEIFLNSTGKQTPVYFVSVTLRLWNIYFLMCLCKRIVAIGSKLIVLKKTIILDPFTCMDVKVGVHLKEKDTEFLVNNLTVQCAFFIH